MSEEGGQVTLKPWEVLSSCLGPERSPTGPHRGLRGRGRGAPAARKLCLSGFHFLPAQPVTRMAAVAVNFISLGFPRPDLAMT